MFHWLHKYKKAIWITLSLLLIPTFIYWGAGTGGGGSGQNGNLPSVVAMVGEVPIYSTHFQDRLQQEMERQASYTGRRPELDDMVQSGQANAVLVDMIDTVLLEQEASARGYEFSDDYLIERLKADATFKDERGNYDPALWNDFVERNQKSNWNDIYGMIRSQVARQTLIQEIIAPAHVTEAELRDRFERDHSEINVKFVAIDPKVEPTDEQIKEHYETNPARYAIPEKRTVEFASISIVPPVPEVFSEIITRAEAGEDFEELVKEFSDSGSKESGGDIGWIEDREGFPEQLKVLFTTPVGGLTDPIYLSGRYHLLKVEEEKTTDDVRSVRVKEIGIEPKLDDAARAEKVKQANDLLAAARETTSLKLSASEAGVPVDTAVVSSDTSKISGVSDMDMFQFRMAAEKLGEGELSDVVEATDSLYIIRVDTLTPEFVQPLEDVKDEVKVDVIASIKATPEHAAEVEAKAKELAEGAASLDDIVAKAPELDLEVKESEKFARTDSLMKQGISVLTQNIFDAADAVEPGAVFGPIKGFTNIQYVFELIEKTGPSEEDWANVWPDEESKLREQLLSQRQNQLYYDYMLNLRDKTQAQIVTNQEVFNKVVGLDREMDDLDLDVSTDDPTATDDAATAAEGGEESAPGTVTVDAAPAEDAATDAEPADVEPSDVDVAPADVDTEEAPAAEEEAPKAE